MLQIRHILCPIDFSDFSRRAFDHAIALARWYEARVIALYVHAIGVGSVALPPGAPAVAQPVFLSTADRDLLLNDLRRFTAAEGGDHVPVDIHLVEGTVWREIVAKAEHLGADLIVMGTHGRSGFERLMLGSVTEKVLRRAHCPVLTVPKAAGDVVPIGPGLFTRILCPTDFSAASTRSLEWAASIAQEADAELLTTHVLEPPLSSAVSGFPRSSLTAYRAAYEEWARDQLQAAVPADVRTYCTVKEITTSGTAYREILKIAEDHACDLIVMGASSHGAVERAFFGSTTQHVVRLAPCPVLTVRA